MTRVTPLFSCSLVVLATLAASGCGSRQLQSIALTPASADAKDYPNGQIPLTATGTYSQPPSPVQLTSNEVVWCAGDTGGECVGNIVPPVTVDQNGLAQCGPTFVGTATVLAGTQSSAMVNPDGGSQLKVFGSAQVTCP
jgi:hypothetical protein